MEAASILDTVLDGRYRLLRLIGTGGGGNVYEAENIRTLHRVAIKVLHSHLVKHERMLERFHQEAQAAGRIGSDKIVRAFDLGELPDGSAYLVMERLDGEDLTKWIERAGGIVAPELLAPIAIQVLDALVAAHDAGVIHRDVKPDNIFLTNARDGVQVKILDFGVSKFLTSGDNTETRPGVVVGSPVYMSPEQARGQADVDGLTDVYSLGVILFECATGRTPFEADNFNDLLFKIVLENAPHPSDIRPDLDAAFAAIIHRAIKRDRAARFRSAREFREALRTWVEQAPVATEAAALGGNPPSPNVSRVMLSALHRGNGTPSPQTAAELAGAQTPQAPQVAATGAGAAAATEPAKSDRSRLLILIAAAFLMLLGLAAFAMMRTRAPVAGSGERPKSSGAQDPTATPAPSMQRATADPATTTSGLPATAESTVASTKTARPVSTPTGPHVEKKVSPLQTVPAVTALTAAASPPPPVSVEPPPSTPTATTKPADKVEGRSIRTEL